jgi:hypothetical protein
MPQLGAVGIGRLGRVDIEPSAGQHARVKRVTQSLLAAVAGLDEQALLAGLREAVDQQLLLPDPGGGGSYVFRHALVAEAVYAELLAGERVRLHTALAGALEAGLEAGTRRRPGRRGWPTTGGLRATSPVP